MNTAVEISKTTAKSIKDINHSTIKVVEETNMGATNTTNETLMHQKSTLKDRYETVSNGRTLLPADKSTKSKGRVMARMLAEGSKNLSSSVTRNALFLYEIVPAHCPQGYQRKKGSYEGDSFVTTHARGRKECAEDCNKNIKCSAFEHSRKLELCMMLQINETNVEDQEDYVFCAKMRGKKK